MKLFYNKKSNDPTYYAQQGIRNGNKTTTRNVKNFGKHSELLKITDDPLAYVREEIQKMNEEYRVGRDEYEMKVDFNEKVKSTDAQISASSILNIGYFYLQAILKELHLKTYFNNKSAYQKNNIDSYLITRFLTYNLILSAEPKYERRESLAAYYEKPDFTCNQIALFMDALEENYGDYISWLCNKSKSIIKRDNSTLYYHCINFYFEKETKGYLCTDELINKGFHENKLPENRINDDVNPAPAIKMEMLMDRRGIPVSMALHPENMEEQKLDGTAEKAFNKILDTASVIYCADGRFDFYRTTKHNKVKARGYVIIQSIDTLADSLKSAVCKDCGYKLITNNKDISVGFLSSFDSNDTENMVFYQELAYKVLDASKFQESDLYEKQFLQDSKEENVRGSQPKRVIIIFSRKMMEAQRMARNRNVEAAKMLLQLNDPETIKNSPRNVKCFLKKVYTSHSGENKDDIYVLDAEKITEESKFDGYYCLVTNLDEPAKDILMIYQHHSMIEYWFQMPEIHTDLKAVSLNDRGVKARFLLSFTALLVSRILECRLEDQGSNITTDNLIRTLKNLNVANVHDTEFMALYTGSQTLDSLEKIAGLGLDFAHYRVKDLNKIIRKILQ